MKDNETYYYICGLYGMASCGDFTKDKSRWVVFSKEYKESIESNKTKPYGATKWGSFISTNKF